MNYLKIAYLLLLVTGSSLFCMFNRFKPLYPATKFVWAHKKKIVATIGLTTFYKDYKNKNKSLPMPVKLALSTFSGPLMVLKDHYFDQDIQERLHQTYGSLSSVLSLKKAQKNLDHTDTSLEPFLDPSEFVSYEYLTKVNAARKKALSDALLSGDTKCLNRLLGSAIDEKNLTYNLYALECEKKKIGFSLEDRYTVTPYFIDKGVRENIDSLPFQCGDQSLLKYACDTLAELDAEGKIDTAIAQKNLLLLTAYNPQPETIARCFSLIMKTNKQIEDIQEAPLIQQASYESTLKKIRDIFS